MDFLSICSRASLSHAFSRCSTISNLLQRARALRQIIRGRGGAALGTNWTTCRAVSNDRLAFIPFAMELPGGTATSCHTAHLTGRLVLAGHAGPLSRDQLFQPAQKKLRGIRTETIQQRPSSRRLPVVRNCSIVLSEVFRFVSRIVQPALDRASLSPRTRGLLLERCLLSRLGHAT